MVTSCCHASKSRTSKLSSKTRSPEQRGVPGGMVPWLPLIVVKDGSHFNLESRGLNAPKAEELISRRETNNRLIMNCKLFWIVGCNGQGFYRRVSGRNPSDLQLQIWFIKSRKILYQSRFFRIYENPFNIKIGKIQSEHWLWWSMEHPLLISCLELDCGLGLMAPVRLGGWLEIDRGNLLNNWIGLDTGLVHRRHYYMIWFKTKPGMGTIGIIHNLSKYNQ